MIKHLNQPVKILGKGDIKNPLNVNVEFFSDVAKEKIEKAGGKAEAIC